MHKIFNFYHLQQFFHIILKEIFMKELSLCMIVKNEEKCLGDALACGKKFADEIIIVDTGSTDKTKEIAKKFTDKVFDFEWVYDFSKARNFAFDKATKEYLMWLDGDDILLEDSIEAINDWKENGETAETIMCPYVTGFDSAYNPTFMFNRERIVKNLPILRWHDPVHEVITPYGKIITNEKIKVYHNKKNKPHTDRNLNIYKHMISQGVKFTPRQQFYYARELYYKNFIDEAIHEFSIFISSKDGWIENKIEACLNLSKCYQIKKDTDKALTCLFGSFVYSTPRGEILYEIGNIFFNLRNYQSAIYWYDLALKSKPDLGSGAFVNIDCYQFLPALQLCVCYYKVGDIVKSRCYHELSKGFKPDDERVKFNETFFAKKAKDE